MIRFRGNFFYFRRVVGGMSLRCVSRLGICQLNSTDDKQRNLRIAQQLIEQSKEQNAQMVFLPEGFDYICSNRQATIDQAESLDGPLINAYRQLAKKHQLWISLGGFHEKVEKSERIFNSHLLINAEGDLVARYAKVHLFDVQSGSTVHKESSFTQPGEEILPPVSTPIGRLALGICYDLRFVEFSRLLSLAGAELLSYPSAFTQLTGEAHWHVLLRARAIENQCFVVAAAQVGEHPGRRRSYGHSLVVDPWGKILLDMGEEHSIVKVIEIDLKSIEEIKEKMPIGEHRREDLYQLTEKEKKKKKKSVNNPFLDEKIRWGQIEISTSQIFYHTELTFAMVNRKPVVEGHVLVSPIRCVERFSELRSEEIADLFQTVQFISRRIEEFYHAQSLTISVQDGPFAGQTIRHVHVHLLPRRQGDFEDNDTIYHKLAHHDRQSGGWRSEEEMDGEAQFLRQLFALSSRKEEKRLMNYFEGQ